MAAIIVMMRLGGAVDEDADADNEVRNDVSDEIDDNRCDDEGQTNDFYI